VPSLSQADDPVENGAAGRRSSSHFFNLSAMHVSVGNTAGGLRRCLEHLSDNSQHCGRIPDFGHVKRFNEPALHGRTYSVVMKLYTFTKRRPFCDDKHERSQAASQNEPMSFVELCHSTLSTSPYGDLPLRTRLLPSTASPKSDIRGMSYVLTRLPSSIDRAMLCE
jgi:hypothetical protein